MAAKSKPKPKLRCSFCGKDQDQVQKLIAGSGVFICDECIDLSNRILADENTVPRLPDWQTMSDESILAGLPQVAAVSAQAEFSLHERIAELRKRGLTWAQLGGALGVTRQAAWERFARGGDAEE
jgi:hypothetical protein